MRAPLLLGLLLGLVLSAAGCGPTYVASVGPVCGRAEVVTFLNEALRRRDPYEEVVPDTVAERTVAGGRSECAAYARQLVFDTGRLGRNPAVGLRPVAYSVREASGGGLVVEMLR